MEEDECKTNLHVADGIYNSLIYSAYNGSSVGLRTGLIPFAIDNGKW